MISALVLALGDILHPRLRRALVFSLIGAVIVLAGLSAGLVLLLHQTEFFQNGLFDGAVEFLGGIAVLVLSWLLFPPVVTIVLGFFLEGAIAVVEAQRYPFLPRPRRQGAGEMLRGGLRLALLGIVINLLALPLYLFLPGLNFVIFYGLNGWLLGREYFEMIALRRLDHSEVRRMWRKHRLRLVAAGMIIAVLLTVPLVNLAAPLIAALFMLHLFERLPQRMNPVLESAELYGRKSRLQTAARPFGRRRQH